MPAPNSNDPKDQRSTILVVDDEPYVLESLRRLVESDGFLCLTASSAEAAAEILRSRDADVVLTDLSMPGEDGIGLLRRSRELDPNRPVIVLTGVGTVASAVSAMKEGAADFLQKPVEPGALLALLRRAVEHGELVNEVRSLRASAREWGESSEIVGSSPAIQQVLQTVAAVAATDSRILIFGESGAGKELVAHAIHARSRRARKPFVRVNCAAIPDTLFESEFFGHKRGAFTGAADDRQGRFAEAQGGTIALDEVGTLQSGAQAKLLRVIESGEYQSVGESKTKIADARVISITNENLEARVRAGTFREDLYYRLNVVPIVVPPLRARKEDIAELAARFLREFAKRNGAPERRLGAGAIEVLCRYDWPGNVRELRNALERAALLVPSQEIDGEALAGIVEGGMFTPSRGVQPASVSADADLRLRERTNALERQLIMEAMRRTGGKKRDAANLLGIDSSNFSYYAKKHQLGAEG
jgi:DNA-binding NtrC family response regulator